MKKIRFFVPGIFALLTIWGMQLFAQTATDIQSQLRAVENEISRARQQKVNLISPKNFEEANDYFEKARKSFEKQQKISKIQDYLLKSARALRLANDIALQGQEVFKAVFEARDDALTARATEYAPDEFQRSEKLLFEAARKLEKGDVKAARKKSPAVEEAFRRAELLAIKESIIGPVRDLLLKAKEEKIYEYAPATLQRAQQLYEKATAILESNRYAKNNALELAEEAAYETRHAFFLSANIRELKKDNSNWEILIRDFESRLDNIAGTLSIKGRFDEGFTRTEKEIILTIRNLQEENQSLKEDLNNALQEIDSLSAKIQEYESTVITELERRKQWEEKIKEVEKMFTPDEAKVLLSGNQMIIRLYGLTFQSGKTVISPEHFRLLTKVMRALRSFPNRKIYVNGHTDAQGNDAFNQRLSEERAAAVKAYLEANMGILPDQIESVGYGESKPIATNETIEGRRMNRRIEIMVSLQEEVLSSQK